MKRKAAVAGAFYPASARELRRQLEEFIDPAAERVLSLAGDNQWAEIDLNEIPSDPERAFKALLAEVPLPAITDESGASIPLTLSNYGRYRSSSDRAARWNAHAGIVRRSFPRGCLGLWSAYFSSGGL